MARDFKELQAKMSAEGRAASEDERLRLVDEMSLRQLRKAREQAETKIAGDLSK